jgi:hypothetical protein
VQVTDELLTWADIVFVIERRLLRLLRRRFATAMTDKPLVCLDVPDDFQWGQSELVAILTERLAPHLGPPANAEAPDQAPQKPTPRSIILGFSGRKRRRGLRGMLSQLLLPILHQRFPDRGLIEGKPPEPCAVFPGLHPGIRSISIYEENDELTLCVDDLTHGHFSEYTEGLSDAEREQRIIESVVEFLEAMFANKVVVWGREHMGGWYFTERSQSNTVMPFEGTGSEAPTQTFVWSGPYRERPGASGSSSSE